MHGVSLALRGIGDVHGEQVEIVGVDKALVDAVGGVDADGAAQRGPGFIADGVMEENGAGLLGAGSLDDLSLALFIGLASGAYSSIFIATPLLCDFKEREPTYQQLAKRVANRRTRPRRARTPRASPTSNGSAPSTFRRIPPSRGCPI